MPSSPNRMPRIVWRTTIIFMLAAVAFVVVANLVSMTAFGSASTKTWVETVVDVVFVLLMGLMIYNLVRWELRHSQQVEAELRQSTNLLTKAASIASLGSFHWDYQTGKVIPSEEMLNLFGLTSAEFDGDPDSMVRLTVHPADLERMLQTNKQVLAHRQPIASEYRIVRNGETRWLFGDGANLYDPSGQAVAMVGILQDITERKKAADDLRLQSAALEAAANAIVITDPAGGVSWVNPAFVKLTGYPLQAILGKNIRTLTNTAEHDTASYEALWSTILAGEVWQGEIVNQRQDGSLYVEDQTITPVRDSLGAITHFVAISQDVSERRQAEDKLRESEERFRRLAERIPDIIYRYRLLPTPTLEYVSPAITTIAGYTPDEVYQHPEILAQGVLPADRSTFERAERLPLVTLRIHHKDGRVVWLEQRHVPVFNEAGQVVAMEGAARDITERVHHQQELEAIASISTVLRTASTRAEMLPLVLEQIRTVLGAGDAVIITPDPASTDLIVELGLGNYGEQITGKRLTQGNLSSQVLEARQPYISNAIQEDPTAFWLVKPPPEIWAAVGMPLLSEAEAMGVLWVYHHSPFTDQEVQMLGALANIIATALQRITLHEQTRQRTEQLAILNEVGNALAETLNLTEILRRLAEAAQKLLPDVVALFVSLYEQETGLISVAFGIHNNEAVDVQQLPPMPLEPDGQGTPSAVIRSGHPLILNDLRAAKNEAPNPAVPTAQSAIYVPLKAKGAVIGLLQVQSEQLNRFGPAETELLSLIGNSAAIAIQNSRLFTENMERLETITALYVSAQKLSFDRDLNRLTRDVVRTCVDSYGAQAVWLARVESDSVLRPLAFYPPENSQLSQMGARWNDNQHGQLSPARKAIDSGFPVIINDLQQDPDFKPWLDLVEAQQLRSCIALPLISRDEPIGTLCLFSTEVGFFKLRRQSFLQAYAHHVSVALENARLIAETGRRLQQLQSLRAIDAAITGSLDLRLNLKIILDQVITQLGSDAADLLILNKNTLALEYTAGRGFLSNTRQAMRFQVGQGLAGQVALSRRPLSIPFLAQEPANDQTASLTTEGFASYYGMPLIAKGQVTGVLEIFHRRPFTPDPEWLEFLKSLTEQSAIAIDNATLFAGLQRTNLELALAYDATIEGWSRAMDLRDKETEGHTQRVTEMALTLASRLGLSGEELMHLRRGGLLHDIGKMGVPDHILLKPESLTPEEWVMMKMHPTYAYQMLSSIAYLRPALDIPYCHHEKWDGSGYPRGLKNEQIPLAARIFSVVDVWDALRSDRPYRAAWPEEKVREHIRNLSGTHFDPTVVNVFLNMV
jgi:PAS domain S-box-containing protein